MDLRILAVFILALIMFCLGLRSGIIITKQDIYMKETAQQIKALEEIYRSNCDIYKTEGFSFNGKITCKGVVK